jgi:hypothetical protein
MTPESSRILVMVAAKKVEFEMKELPPIIKQPSTQSKHQEPRTTNPSKENHTTFVEVAKMSRRVRAGLGEFVAREIEY